MYFPESKDAASFFHLVHVWKTISSLVCHCNDRLGNATELNEGKPKFLSFWRPKFLKARGSIKRSPIVENSLCPFSPMQHWSVYLTMSHESNWHPSEWTMSVGFDSETAEWSSGEEVGPVLPDEWWTLFNICQGPLQNILKIMSLVKGWYGTNK